MLDKTCTVEDLLAAITDEKAPFEDLQRAAWLVAHEGLAKLAVEKDENLRESYRGGLVIELKDLLAHERWEVRIAAVSALGILGGMEAFEALLKQASKPDEREDVKLTAINKLINLVKACDNSTDLKQMNPMIQKLDSTQIYNRLKEVAQSKMIKTGLSPPPVPTSARPPTPAPTPRIPTPPPRPAVRKTPPPGSDVMSDGTVKPPQRAASTPPPLPWVRDPKTPPPVPRPKTPLIKKASSG